MSKTAASFLCTVWFMWYNVSGINCWKPWMVIMHSLPPNSINLCSLYSRKLLQDFALAIIAQFAAAKSNLGDRFYIIRGPWIKWLCHKRKKILCILLSVLCQQRNQQRNHKPPICQYFDWFTSLTWLKAQLSSNACRWALRNMLNHCVNFSRFAFYITCIRQSCYWQTLASPAIDGTARSTLVSLFCGFDLVEKHETWNRDTSP